MATRRQDEKLSAIILARISEPSMKPLDCFGVAFVVGHGFHLGLGQ